MNEDKNVLNRYVVMRSKSVRGQVAWPRAPPATLRTSAKRWCMIKYYVYLVQVDLVLVPSTSAVRAPPQCTITFYKHLALLCAGRPTQQVSNSRRSVHRELSKSSTLGKKCFFQKAVNFTGWISLFLSPRGSTPGQGQTNHNLS